MRIRPIFMLAVASMVAFGALGQGSLTISHQPPSCIPSLCGRVPLYAIVTGTSEVKSVRVYFRAEGDGPEYYLEMLAREDANYMAVLPAPLRETESVQHRIVAVAEDGSMTVTEPVTVPVEAACVQSGLSEDEQNFADNIILGLTDASQTGAPNGFSCAGVVMMVSVDQTMGPNTACEEVRRANADPCVAALVGTGDPKLFGFGPLAAITGAVVAGAVIIENNNDEDREPVSPARP